MDRGDPPVVIARHGRPCRKMPRTSGPCRVPVRSPSAGRMHARSPVLSDRDSGPRLSRRCGPGGVFRYAGSRFAPRAARCRRSWPTGDGEPMAGVDGRGLFESAGGAGRLARCGGWLRRARGAADRSSHGRLGRVASARAGRRAGGRGHVALPAKLAAHLNGRWGVGGRGYPGARIEVQVSVSRIDSARGAGIA